MVVTWWIVAFLHSDVLSALEAGLERVKARGPQSYRQTNRYIKA